MQIEAGKFYRTRDGQKVGPMGCGVKIMWAAIDGEQAGYFLDGRRATSTARSDLIAEWTEATSSEPASEEITWGEWGPAKKQAGDCQMQNIGGVQSWRYPVPKQPVVETVTLSGGYFGAYGWRFGSGISGGNVTYRITFETKDGEPDWSTLRGEDIS